MLCYSKTVQMRKNKVVSCFHTLKCYIYHANIVKVPTNVGTLTFMSMINFMLSSVEHETSWGLISNEMHLHATALICFLSPARCATK